jgi:hypothetical protein
LTGSAVEPDAERLAQDDLVSRLRIGIAFDVPWIDEADRDESIDRFDGIHAVAARDGNASALTHRLAALEDAPDRLDRQLVDRHRHQRERKQRPAAHRVHIRDGVRRGNRAEVERSSTIGMKKSVVATIA